jgi:hypothetical protein
MLYDSVIRCKLDARDSRVILGLSQRGKKVRISILEIPVSTPTYFMNLMNRVFMEELDKFVVVFIDNILIYSKSAEEHGQHLRVVLKRLRTHKLYAKFSMCEFWLKKVAFLCHILIAEGVAVDPEKVEAISH